MVIRTGSHIIEMNYPLKLRYLRYLSYFGSFKNDLSRYTPYMGVSLKAPSSQHAIVHLVQNNKTQPLLGGAPCSLLLSEISLLLPAPFNISLLAPFSFFLCSFSSFLCSLFLFSFFLYSILVNSIIPFLIFAAPSSFHSFVMLRWT